ncbi:hypothetical protein CRG98_046204 [Punica granatum]|uniref:Uncharacterized protein n=1 Tax=Punica granatum TaxID=22663 RepID=A0A2I0HNU7_PUNGR|nr:hypothetical protein CRG98_046204 [Punica granatum]
MSCKPPSCLITRPGNMSVLPKWLRRGTPTIPGHPVIMGPPGFQRATHRNRAGVNSRQKCLHSEKLRSGGGMTGGCRRPKAGTRDTRRAGRTQSKKNNKMPVRKKLRADSTTRLWVGWRHGGKDWSSMTVPVYAWLPVLLGEPLTRDGGSRYKGVNSLKSSEDLWGPVRWHSRLDPFPYSEPLTNLASYFGAREISDEQTESSPNPLDLPNGVAKLCAPEFYLVGARMREAYATRLGSVHLPGDARRTHVKRGRHLPFYDPKAEGRQVTRGCTCAHPNFISSGYACARLCNAAWECPPSRGRATGAREKELPLAILRPEGRGLASYPGLGVRGTPKC